MNHWMFIEPNDVWMFRDNKPFTASQNFVARSHFPPNPMTMQGVIRSAYLESKGVNWHEYANGKTKPEILDAVGDSSSMGALKLTGPLVGRWNGNEVEYLVRAPLDLLHKNESYRLLTPSKSASNFHSNMPETWLPLQGGGEGYKESNGWLTTAQFQDYLRGDLSNIIQFLKDDDLFQVEERVGLQLNTKRRTNEQSMFYVAQFTRPQYRVGLLVNVPPLLFEKTGYLDIGGESRAGRYQFGVCVPDLPTTGKGNVRIVLLTPAYFSGGWSPKDNDWSPWVGEGRLVSVTLGKPQSISGWDIAKNRPKPLRHYVPAGSVFYFEDAQVKGIPFTETPSHDALNHGAMGFGSYAVGSW